MVARGFSVGSSVRGEVSRGSLQALMMYRKKSKVFFLENSFYSGALLHDVA